MSGRTDDESARLLGALNKMRKRIPAHEMAAKWHELVEYLLSQPGSN